MCIQPCGNLTYGPHCDKCIPGYYGNPLNGATCQRKFIVPSCNIVNLSISSGSLNFIFPLQPAFVIIKARTVRVKRVNVSVQRKALSGIIVNDAMCLAFILEILPIKDHVFVSFFSKQILFSDKIKKKKKLDLNLKFFYRRVDHRLSIYI